MSPLLTALLGLTVWVNAQTSESVSVEKIKFISEGVKLAGTVYQPKHPVAAVVIVHGSGQETRMIKFAEFLANNNISVLTYDKRGVGESGGTYAGPEVGTNNIDSANISLLAKDASAAMSTLKKFSKKNPMGFIGFSQAGWIIPIAANLNPLTSFMVLFSGPTITTLEQLRFQFYTNGRADFWDTHTVENAIEHTRNDPDQFQFVGTDPKDALRMLSIPGLWLFGEKDLQIPVKMCIGQIDTLKAEGKPYEYVLFPSLGHRTAFADDKSPMGISIQWINQKAKASNKTKRKG